MKIQNLAVIFIVIILPIALVLSVYTGNLIEVANRQASYNSILFNSTSDAVRAYQMNTLNNNYEAVTNSKVRDVNATVNAFFISLASGFDSSGLGKLELRDYIPALLFTLYDGYYVYGAYDNIVSAGGGAGVTYSTDGNISNKEYGVKPYIYYSCEYAKGNGSTNGDYDLVINYTLDNYITVTGTYNSGGTLNPIAESGYYINTNGILFNDATKTVTIQKSLSDGTIVTTEISPEKLGEYLITLDEVYNNEYNPTVLDSKKYLWQLSSMQPTYYNYILYNNVKYYLDIGHLNAPVMLDGTDNKSFNNTYGGIPIFYLDNNKRIYISRNMLDELKRYLGVNNDNEMYNADTGLFKDVNAYYYYKNAVDFSNEVGPILSQIDLGKATVTDSTGKNLDVISSNLTYEDNDPSKGLVFYDDSGTKYTTTSSNNNVIKTDTYHMRYAYENGVESHTKSHYTNSKVFDLSALDNDPELSYSSFNMHRLDVIISSIESSLISTIANFNDYSGSTFNYRMPVLRETEWDTICNNVTIVSFMQGLTIGNYKYYSSYSVVADAKVKDYISKESIYVQEEESMDYGTAQSQQYHNPRCSDENSSPPSNLVGYRNIDYDRKICTRQDSADRYFYYLHQGSGGYECVIGQNSNIYTTDELISGTNPGVNPNVRNAYLTALARERENAYKTYGFFNS